MDLGSAGWGTGVAVTLDVICLMGLLQHRAVPKRADFFFCLGAALQFSGRLQPNRRWLEANRRQL